jgi:hypothetical protein
MDPQLWNLLHDGYIEQLAGAVPGEIGITVSIEYLRQRFPGNGDGFVIRLSDCAQFSYAPYDAEPITDLAQILALDPEILSAEAGDPLPVTCVAGTLLLRYASARIELDSGGGVSLEQLHTAAAAYWAQWSERSRTRL